MTRLGYTYLVTGPPEKALAVMQDVLKVNPRSLDALTGLAMILDGLNRDREARDYFEQALSVEPENKFLRVGYAGNLVRGGMLAEGIAVYDRLVKDFPQDPALYRMLGIAYGMGGNFDSAIENFKQIIFIAPNPDAYYNLALCYRQKGDVAEAVKNFEKYLEDPKGEPEGKVQSVRAELARLRGNN
jgi:tetratricopeptide (TPR) repeat protein